MILLAFILIVISIFYNLYYFLAHTRRNLRGETVLIAGRNGSLFRTGSSIFAKHLIFELANQGCNLILLDTPENETSLKELKKEIEDKTNMNCSIFVSDIGDDEKETAVSSTTNARKAATTSTSSLSSSSITVPLSMLPSKTGAVDILMTIPSHLQISSRAKTLNARNHLNVVKTYCFDEDDDDEEIGSGAGTSDGKNSTSSGNTKNNINKEVTTTLSKTQVVTFAGFSGVFGSVSATLSSSKFKGVADAASNAALIGIAESLSSSCSSSCSTLVCSTLFDEVRYCDEYVDVGTLQKIDQEIVKLVDRTIEGIRRKEARVFVPWTVLPMHLAKLLPLSWAEGLMNRLNFIGQFAGINVKGGRKGVETKNE